MRWIARCLTACAPSQLRLAQQAVQLVLRHDEPDRPWWSIDFFSPNGWWRHRLHPPNRGIKCRWATTRPFDRRGRADPVPIRKRKRALPAALAEVIDHALVEKPEIGFRTAIELQQALFKVL